MILEGDVVHGYNNPSVSRIVEVRSQHGKKSILIELVQELYIALNSVLFVSF